MRIHTLGAAGVEVKNGYEKKRKNVEHADPSSGLKKKAGEFSESIQDIFCEQRINNRRSG